MTTSDQARRVAERYVDAWRGDDLAGILDCYADDFTLHYFGDNPFTGDHVGKDAAIEVLLAAGARAPRRLIDVEDVLAGPGAAAIVAVEELDTATGPARIRRVLRYRIAADRFAECWLYEEHQDVVDRAWADPSTSD